MRRDWRVGESIQLQDYTSEVSSGQTVKNPRAYVKDFDLESNSELLRVQVQ